MNENQNDRQFDNSGKGQYNEDSQRREDTSSVEQRRPDRTDEIESNYPSSDQDRTGVSDGNSRSDPMNKEEYDRSRLHDSPNNNNPSSMNNEEEEDLDEEDDIDLDEEEDENEETNPIINRGQLTGMGDSQDPRDTDYRNAER